MENNNCDGSWCIHETGEVRLLPTGGGSNAIFCKACHMHELQWRKEQDSRVYKSFALPTWESLEIYVSE